MNKSIKEMPSSKALQQNGNRKKWLCRLWESKEKKTGTWFPTSVPILPSYHSHHPKKKKCWTNWVTTLLRSLMELRPQGKPLLWSLERWVNTGENSLWGTEAPGEFKFLGAQFWGSPNYTSFIFYLHPEHSLLSHTGLFSKETPRPSLI